MMIVKAHDYSIKFRNKGITNYGCLIIVSLTSVNFKCEVCASSPSEVEKNINTKLMLWPMCFITLGVMFMHHVPQKVKQLRI